MSTLNPSPSEDIIFKNDQHAANISDNLLKFYEKSEFFDTILIAGSECINIHANRNILAAASEYFLDKFRESHLTAKGNQVELKEIDSTALKLIVDFMYSGWIVLNLKNAERILRTAATLKMKILVDGCCEFIEKHIDTSNCLKWLLLSKELSLSGLEDNSLKYTYTHIDEISKKFEFLQLNEDELKGLLFNNAYSDGAFEEAVFRSLIAWIEYEKVNREHLLCRLLKMVRYQLLTPKFINEHRNLVCKNVEISELVFSWLQWHLSSESELVNDHQQSCMSEPKQEEGKVAIIYTTDQHDIVIQTYDPELDSWSIEKKLRIWKRKYSYSLTVIGRKLFIGGLSSWNGITVECLDLDTFKWTDLPAMNKKRYKGCNLADFNGNLLVSGSQEIIYSSNRLSDEFNDSIEIYSFSTREWQLKMMSEKSCDTSAYCYNGLIYIVDLKKKILESFDISNNEWTSEWIENISSDCGFVGFGGFLYFTGRIDRYSDNRSMYLNRYDISEDTWFEMAALTLPSRSGNYYPTKATVFGNKIIVVCDRKLVYEYNPETDTWTTFSPLPIESVGSNICTFTYYD